MLNFVDSNTKFELSLFRVTVHMKLITLAHFHQNLLEPKYFCHYIDHLHIDLSSYYCFPRVVGTFFASCNCDCLKLRPILFLHYVDPHQF